MHAPLLSSLSPTRHTGLIVTDVWVPAYHLAKAVGIYGDTTPRAGSVRRIGPNTCAAEFDLLQRH
jgi:hypothetical protein